MSEIVCIKCRAHGSPDKCWNCGRNKATSTRVRVTYRPPNDPHNRVIDTDVPPGTDGRVGVWRLVRDGLPIGSEFRGMFSLDI